MIGAFELEIGGGGGNRTRAFISNLTILQKKFQGYSLRIVFG